jgi:bifunctional DNA-binding transcriptional regulator/antitoxin component of YhaV-PrlF toxin-antitoxin module
MSLVKVHYDGWIALPGAFRRALGLGTGVELEAELVDGAVVLRPVAARKGQEAASRRGRVEVALDAEEGTAASSEVELAAPGLPLAPERLATTVAAPARRRPGRKPKVKAADPAAEGTSKAAVGRAKLGSALSPVRRVRGRKAGGAGGGTQPA